jgi:hypothetical protein
VAEDNAINRMVAVGLLQGLGYAGGRGCAGGGRGEEPGGRDGRPPDQAADAGASGPSGHHGRHAADNALGPGLSTANRGGDQSGARAAAVACEARAVKHTFSPVSSTVPGAPTTLVSLRTALGTAVGIHDLLGAACA